MMKNVYPILVLFAFIALVIYGRWWYVCEALGKCGDEEAINNQIGLDDVERTKDLAFIVDGNPLFEGYDQFAFQRLSSTILPEGRSGGNDSNVDFLNKVLDYLNENPNAQLKISGRFLPIEKDSTSGIFENLGLARADVIREWFKIRNIEVRRITISSEETNDANINPLSFSADSNNDGIPTAYDDETVPRYTFENMTYKFGYNSAEFNPNDAFKTYSKKLKDYIENEDHFSKQILIVGHTDDKGSDAFNYNLGKDRAENAKTYFVKNTGIAADKIITDTRGKSKPIASNETEDGQSQNRRINIQIVD